MIGKIFGMFKSSSEPSLKDTLEGVKLIGNLFRKNIGKKKEEISEECVISMSVMNYKAYDYNLNIYNEDYQYNKGKIKHSL